MPGFPGRDKEYDLPIESNVTLSKNLQIEFNNQLGKYMLTVLEIESIQPLKSLANCSLHIYVCEYQWSAP